MSTVLIYIINVILFAAISYGCYLKYQGGPLQKHYWSALIFKLICGILLGLLFFQHYRQGDTINYYAQASLLSELNAERFWSAIFETTISSQPVRAIYFVRLVAVVKWLTGADYWILSAYFSLFSFLGCIYLSEKLVLWQKDLLLPAYVAFLYYPSAVFWSSGLLKESLAFGALTFLFGTYLTWNQNRKLHLGNVLILLLTFLVITSIKYYIGAVLIPVLAYLVLYHIPFWEKKKIRSLWAKTSLLILVLSIPTLIFLAWLSPNLSYSELWGVMKTNHYEYIRLAPDGALHTLNWFGSELDLVINVPYLWFSGIFKPLLWEDLTFPGVFSGLENTLLLLGAVYAFYLFFKMGHVNKPAELLAIFFYVSVLSIFLSYSAPNFGTLARYKIYYSPFLVLIVAFRISTWKISKKD